MRFDESTSLGPLTETTLADYESRLGARLPDDYRRYLLEQNGSLPEQTCYAMPEETDWIEDVDQMSGLGDPADDRSLSHYLTGNHGIPSGWIPIAHSGFGDYTVLSVREEDFGCVYYLFHEIHGYDPDNRTDGVYLLGGSFTEWIEGLADCPEAD